MLRGSDLKGLWRRTFLQDEGQGPDRTSRVFWLQGPRFFVDLRQPADLPDFDDVRCLRDLTIDQLRELARQEGFAGILEFDGVIADWKRLIDFQPDTGVADRGRLQRAGKALIELGTERSYVEEWLLELDPLSPVWGACLCEMDGDRRGFVARVGDRLMFARDRARPLPPGGSLCSVLDDAPTRLAQDLLDFEISIGRIEEGAWLIDHSTLPFKAGRRWSLRIDAQRGDILEMEDLEPEGEIRHRRWSVVETDMPEWGFHLAAKPVAAAE